MEIKDRTEPIKKWRRMDFKCCFRICIDAPKIKEAAVIAIAENG
jgi:hypothetical protein